MRITCATNMTQDQFGEAVPSVSDSCAPLSTAERSDSETLLGDRALLAQHTLSLLDQMGLSYQEQERHTSVSASTVYAMAQGQPHPSHIFAIQRFAAFAIYQAKERNSQIFWSHMLQRLAQDERQRLSHPINDSGHHKHCQGCRPSLAEADRLSCLWKHLVDLQRRHLLGTVPAITGSCQEVSELLSAVTTERGEGITLKSICWTQANFHKHSKSLS